MFFSDSCGIEKLFCKLRQLTILRPAAAPNTPPPTPPQPPIIKLKALW